MSTRTTRSRSRNPENGTHAAPDPPKTIATTKLQLKQEPQGTMILGEADLAKELQTLSKHQRDLVCLKQQKLQQTDGQIHKFIRECGSSSRQSTRLLAQAAAATFAFAGDAAGTAACISSSGILLTCSHCIAESPSELDVEVLHMLLSASGVLVKARCVAWDHKRDLALLKIVTVFSSSIVPDFSSLFINLSTPKTNSKLVCIGHPGAEDLEADRPGVSTGYDVLHISHGRFRGYAAGQDVEDNSEIGALMHDCWTYWGHSGAPLLEFQTGRLIGVHSSWDDETGMRRGVGWQAVTSFLAEHCNCMDIPLVDATASV